MRIGKRRKDKRGDLYGELLKPQHKYLMGAAGQTGERFCMTKKPEAWFHTHFWCFSVVFSCLAWLWGGWDKQNKKDIKKSISYQSPNKMDCTVLLPSPGKELKTATMPRAHHSSGKGPYSMCHTMPWPLARISTQHLSLPCGNPGLTLVLELHI